MKKIVLTRPIVDQGQSYTPEEWLRMLENTTAWRPPQRVIAALRKKVGVRDQRRNEYGRAA